VKYRKIARYLGHFMLVGSLQDMVVGAIGHVAKLNSVSGERSFHSFARRAVALARRPGADGQCGSATLGMLAFG
jgi:hypothetical protein